MGDLLHASSVERKTTTRGVRKERYFDCGVRPAQYENYNLRIGWKKGRLVLEKRKSRRALVKKKSSKPSSSRRRDSAEPRGRGISPESMGCPGSGWRKLLRGAV